MAEGGGQASISRLDCSICLEDFKTPKLLPCHHTFCAVCLEKYIEKNRRGNAFDCPLCRKTVDVPRKGVEEFQTNFYIEPSQCGGKKELIPCDACRSKNAADHRCLDCEENFCSRCTEAHMNMKVSRHHRLLDLEAAGAEERRKIKVRVFCSKHPNDEIKVVCQQCSQSICVICLVTEHQGHKSREVTEEAIEVRTLLNSAVKAQELIIQGQKEIIEGERKEKSLLKGTLESEIQVVNKHWNEIKRCLNVHVQNIHEKLRKEYIHAMNEKDETINVSQKYCSSSTAVVSAAREALDVCTDMELVQKGKALCNDLRKNIKQEPRKDKQVNPSLTLFTCGGIDTGQLKKMVGEVRQMAKPIDVFPINGRLKIVSSFTAACSEGGYIFGIAPVKHNRAWLSFLNDSIELVTRDGTKVLTVDVGTKCYTVASDTNDNCIVSCPYDRTIKRVTTTGKIETLFSGIQPDPWGVAYRKTGDGKEEVIFSCFNESGGEPQAKLCVAEYRVNAKPTTLCSGFVFPYFVAVNGMTNQIFVADTSKNNVTLIDENLVAREAYLPGYAAFGVSFDRQGCMLVSGNRGSESVHRLKQDGKTMFEILHNVKGARTAVDSDGCIWVGDNCGKIRIYEVQ